MERPGEAGEAGGGLDRGLVAGWRRWGWDVAVGGTGLADQFAVEVSRRTPSPKVANLKGSPMIAGARRTAVALPGTRLAMSPQT